MNICCSITIVGLLLSILGIIFITLGCNTRQNDDCYLYSFFEGNVIETTMELGICSQTHDCYDVNVYAQDNNGTICEYSAASGESLPSAYATAQEYPEGKYVEWYRAHNTNNCQSGEQLFTSWVIGVTFLWCGSMLFCVACGRSKNSCVEED